MGFFFGTDGIRGIVGQELTYSLAIKCGNALARLKNGCKILIGQDTRVSGQMILSSVSLGANLGGAQVTNVGVASTPCISYLTTSLNFDFGVVITASHNPSEYNGIKIFDSTGRKLSDKQEELIERYMIKDMVHSYSSLGKTIYKPGLISKYINYLCSQVGSLKGVNIAIDCANGASKNIAKRVFKKLQATVKFVGMKGGENINLECGATYPQKLAEFVKKHNLDYGFCFDGDADRIVMVSKDKIYSGDNILYCLALHFGESVKTVVGTSLTNLGLELALKNKSIMLERADVGDRFVIEKMQEKQTWLGGEESGHIIVSKILPTGDGLLTALLLTNIIKNQNPELFMHFEAFPQVMRSVKTADKLRSMGNEELSRAISYASEELAGRGRVLVRPSGTENKIRIMVESENLAQAQRLVEFIASKIE